MSDYNLLIDGKMVPGDQTMPVLNPATEEVLAQCPRASKAQLDAAVAAAKAAFPAWAATPMAERRKLVNKMADVIEANSGELAHILTSEQGKPLGDATGEVLGMAAFFRYLSSLELPMKVIEDSGDRKVEAYRRPLGVVGAITPWNFPVILCVEARAGAARRQHGGGEAVAEHAAHDAAVGRADQGRSCRRAFSTSSPTATSSAAQLTSIPTSARSRSPAPSPPARSDGQRGADAEAHHARARRQRRRHRARRRRPEEGRPRALRGAFQNSGQVCIAIKRLYVHENVYDAALSTS